MHDMEFDHEHGALTEEEWASLNPLEGPGILRRDEAGFVMRFDDR